MRTGDGNASRLILAIYLPTAVVALCDGMLTPTLPLHLATFESSLALIGLALAGEAIGMLLGDVPSGWVLARVSAKRALLIGGGVAVVSVLLTAGARDLWSVLALRVAAGAGLSLFNLARHAYLASATRTGSRGRLIALYGGINRLGSFLGPAVGGAVAAALGLTAPLVAYGVLMAAAVALIGLVLPDARQARSATAGDEERLALRGAVPTLVNAGIGQLLGQTVRAGRRVVLPLFGAQALGLDALQVGLIMSAGGLADLLLFYPAGWLMDTRGRKAAIVPCFLAMGLALMLVPLTAGFWTLLAVSVLIGLGNGIGSGTMMTLAADLAPRQATAAFLAWWRLIGDVGMVGGPLVVGFVAQSATLAPAAVAVGSVGVAAAAWFSLRVPETLIPLSSVGDRTEAP